MFVQYWKCDRCGAKFEGDVWNDSGEGWVMPAALPYEWEHRHRLDLCGDCVAAEDELERLRAAQEKADTEMWERLTEMAQAIWAANRRRVLDAHIVAED